MGWVGSANNMKWVGLGVNKFDGLGWVDKNRPMSMSGRGFVVCDVGHIGHVNQ